MVALFIDINKMGEEQFVEEIDAHFNRIVLLFPTKMLSSQVILLEKFSVEHKDLAVINKN